MRFCPPTGFLCTLLVLCCSSAGHAHKPLSSQKLALPRSLPETQGVSPQAVLNFVNEAERNNLGLHSLMLVRHGFVVAEGWWKPFTAGRKHMLFSASKNFTSNAVGLAVAEGRFGLDDRVLSFFPLEAPEAVSENLDALRVRHLLTMSTGQEHDLPSVMDPSVYQPGLLGTESPPLERNWAKQFLAIPVKNPPGSGFFYSSGASYMLSAIVQKTTGQRLLDYLQPRLFDPLGIEGADWETDTGGIDAGGWGLRLKTEDLAKFGQLYLQNGMWNGRSVLPAAWIREATSPLMRSVPPTVVINDPKKDAEHWYGYFFWRNAPGGYRADGAFGQLSIVLPEHDAVVAITGEYYDSQKIVRLVWSHLLPALKATPLPPAPVARKQLAQKLASLNLLPRMGFATCPMPWISGHTYNLSPNPWNATSVSFSFLPGHCEVVLKDDKGRHRIRCGINKWLEGTTDMPGMPPRFLLTSPRFESNLQVAASGTWSDANTFLMTWRFLDTPHSVTVPCRFEGDKVRLEFVSILSSFYKGGPFLKGPNVTLEGAW